MTDVKHHLTELDRLEPPELWDQIERRQPRAELPADAPSRSRKTAVFVLASILTVASVALVVRAFVPTSEGPAPAPNSQAPFGTISETHVLPAAWHLVAAYGSVWVTGGGGVSRVDPSTGEVVATIEVPHADESDISAGDGHVWITAGGAIVGIDAATNQVDRHLEIETGIHAIAFANDRLYVGHSAEGNGTLDEIDPTTGAFGREILTGGPGLGESGIVPTRDAIWVGYSSPAATGGLSSGLVRVSNDLSEAVTVPGVDRVFSLAVAGGHVWAVGTDVLYEVDMDGTLQATFPIPLAGKVASDGEHLWLLTNTGSTSDKVYLPDPNVPARVVEIDTTTGALIGDGIPLPKDVPANLAVGEGRVWVSFYDAGVLNGISTAGPPTPTDRVVTITESGTTAEVPSAWMFVGQPTPDVTDPHTLFAAASFAISAADPCVWLSALPSDGAVVWVEEWHDVPGLGGSVTDFPPKPAEITLGSGQPFAYDCGVPEQRQVLRFPFQQDGRYFWGLVALGSSASTSSQIAAEHVLTSFTSSAPQSP